MYRAWVIQRVCGGISPRWNDHLGRRKRTERTVAPGVHLGPARAHSGAAVSFQLEGAVGGGRHQLVELLLPALPDDHSRTVGGGLSRPSVASSAGQASGGWRGYDYCARDSASPRSRAELACIGSRSATGRASIRLNSSTPCARESLRLWSLSVSESWSYSAIWKGPFVVAERPRRTTHRIDTSRISRPPHRPEGLRFLLQ